MDHWAGRRPRPAPARLGLICPIIWRGMQATIAGGAPAFAVPAERQASGRVRLDSVDLLRGLVIVIMALDHARDYFTPVQIDPTGSTDLSLAPVSLFFTRWITHFCAPVFVFLAGTSAFLYQSRGRSRAEVSRFLVTRGLWLVILEFTVVRWAWLFNFNYTTEMLFVQVIWALGVSMIVLAGLIYLPMTATAAVGIGMILGHNLLDGITPQSLGAWGPLWAILHVQSAIPLGDGQVFFVVYPLIPWIGVMAAGYAFGTLVLRPESERRRKLLWLGVGLTSAFLVIRAVNVYGDPVPWEARESAGRTVLSFLNTTKYPPSLLFLLMTLGPAIAVLPLFERLTGPAARAVIVFGRVPLFFYVLHLYLIHALALIVGTLAGFDPRQFLRLWLNNPEGWGYGLPVVYLVWVGVILALYPACRWFAGLKARRREAWLSYL
jgi:uncharacterized membrane protein